MRYPLVFFVNDLPVGVGGRANGPIIRIDTRLKDDEGIYQHELMHVKQWFMTLGLHGLFYALSDRYRRWSEVQCYRKQAQYYEHDSRQLFAAFIATRYSLNVSQAQAYSLLTEPKD